MWTCPQCGQEFVNQNVRHSCNDRTVGDFLANKSDKTIELYHYFIDEYQKMCDFKLHPRKSHIGFAAIIRFGYIHRLGKDYVDVVLQLREPHEETLCFHKVAGIPGGDLWNHYVRIQEKEDVTEEVRRYMLMSWEMGMKKGR
ncbi:MAG: DUF5655 domain-containing protein [Cyclobacteriaceae bacterium]